jgi:Protein of unknown function (DUF1097)
MSALNKFGLALIIGAWAGFATWLTAPDQLNVPTWVVFLAWASYFIFGAQPKPSAKGLAQVVCGALIAALMLFVGIKIAPMLGLWTFPLLVFIVAFGIAFFEWTPVNNIPAFYIGLSMMVGSGFAPDAPHILKLLIAIALGFVFGLASVVTRTAFLTMADKRSKSRETVYVP